MFGLIAFTDKVESFVRARSGKTHYTPAVTRCTHCSREVSHRISTSCARSFAFDCAARMIVVLTSLDDPALAERVCQKCGFDPRQHLVTVNMISDPQPG